MKKTFVIQVEYPDCDTIHSEEWIEVTKESLEYLLSRYFGANIMDGDYDRIKVKEVTDFISLVKRMREARKEYEDAIDKVYSTHAFWGDNIPYEVRKLLRKLTKKKKALQKEVDEYLKKMEV